MPKNKTKKKYYFIPINKEKDQNKEEHIYIYLGVKCFIYPYATYDNNKKCETYKTAYCGAMPQAFGGNSEQWDYDKVKKKYVLRNREQNETITQELEEESRGVIKLNGNVLNKSIHDQKLKIKNKYVHSYYYSSSSFQVNVNKWPKIEYYWAFPEEFHPKFRIDKIITYFNVKYNIYQKNVMDIFPDEIRKDIIYNTSCSKISLKIEDNILKEMRSYRENCAVVKIKMPKDPKTKIDVFKAILKESNLDEGNVVGGNYPYMKEFRFFSYEENQLKDQLKKCFVDFYNSETFKAILNAVYGSILIPAGIEFNNIDTYFNDNYKNLCVLIGAPVKSDSSKKRKREGEEEEEGEEEGIYIGQRIRKNFKTDTKA